MLIVLVAVLVFVTLSLAVLAYQQLAGQKLMQARVTQLDSAVAMPVLTSGRRKNLEDSFTNRVIIPFAQLLSDKIQALVPMSGKSWIRQKLVQAGYTKPQHLRTFIGVHALSTALPTAFVLFLLLVAQSVTPGMAFMMIALLGGMGFGLPVVWLIQQATKRQDSIRKSLPDFLDLLVISVEAGLGLDMAISKIAKIESMQTSSFLRDELNRYSKDIGFGKPRKEALLALAQRTGVEDLNVIVNAIVQSYEMGTGITQTLKVQSEGLRQKRLHRAEAAANKISVKMVLPIYLFFFPGIFVVILGPMILYTIQQISQSAQAAGPL